MKNFFTSSMKSVHDVHTPKILDPLTKHKVGQASQLARLSQSLAAY
jgi:hypothetical protein